jgi:hypothetical protein
VNGHQIMGGTAQLVDGTYGVENTLLFFADENGEDNLIYCAQLAIFSTCLSAAEVSGLGGFRSSDIKPYLQTPSPTSIYVCWNSFNSASTMVQYGTTTALGTNVTGTNELISSNRWHTVQLTGLTPDTRYYYRCVSGNDTSAIYAFRTPANQGTTGKHIRFVKVGDSQQNAADVSRLIADTIAFVLQMKYGPDWYDSVNFIMHTGDIVSTGSEIGRYMNEYFNAYSSLSAHVPMMVSIGNHEMENLYFYQFMKYDGLTGFSERYYTFNLMDCQFIAMNTNGLYNNITQTNWLQTQLNTSAVDPATDFVFVYGHQPGHSEMWPDGNNTYVEGDVIPLLKGFPKMVLSTYGHSHNYERGTAIGTHSGNWDFRTVLCGGAGGALDRWGMYTNQTDYEEIQKSVDHYSFVLFDVDVDAKKVHATAYSLGHTDLPRNLEVVDRWHRYLNQAAPDKPDAIYPDSSAPSDPTLVASAFSGLDTLMSSQFQLVEISGSFATPSIDVIRDVEDYYGDSGSPLYTPTNLNAGIDLSQYSVNPGFLQTGQTYMWRMRYRDQNVRWSEWSDTLIFQVVSTSVQELQGRSLISAYPNPAEDLVEFQLPETDGKLQLKVLDGNARCVFNQDITSEISSDKRYAWRASEHLGILPTKGVYYFVFTSRSNVETLRIILN